MWAGSERACKLSCGCLRTSFPSSLSVRGDMSPESHQTAEFQSRDRGGVRYQSRIFEWIQPGWNLGINFVTKNGRSAFAEKKCSTHENISSMNTSIWPGHFSKKNIQILRNRPFFYTPTPFSGGLQRIEIITMIPRNDHDSKKRSDRIGWKVRLEDRLRGCGRSQARAVSKKRISGQRVLPPRPPTLEMIHDLGATVVVFEGFGGLRQTYTYRVKFVQAPIPTVPTVKLSPENFGRTHNI